MQVAAAQPCDDFPQPSQPADLSTYSNGYAGDSKGGSSSTDSTSTTYGTTTTTTPGSTDANGDGYPDNAYAPGIQNGGKKKK